MVRCDMGKTDELKRRKQNVNVGIEDIKEERVWGEKKTEGSRM